MTTPQEAIDIYRQLAEEHQRQNHPQERDRFLLLAADSALSAGQRDQAERFRRNILAQNPNHLLKPYPTLAESLQSPDILAYMQQLRRTYPPEKAEELLRTLRPVGAPRARGDQEEFLLDMDAERKGEDLNFTLEPSPLPAKKPIATSEARPMAERDDIPKAGGAPLWRPPAPSPAPEAPNIFKVRPAEPTGPRAVSALPLHANSGTAAEADEPAGGGWVGTLLAFAVVLAGLALLVYTFGRPWLPLP